MNTHVRYPVRVVDVAQGAGQHRLGEIETPAAICGDGGLQRGESELVVEADLPRCMEPVSLPGHCHVVLAGEPKPDRSPRQCRTQGGYRSEAVRLHLLAAEPAAHSQTLNDD